MDGRQQPGAARLGAGVAGVWWVAALLSAIGGVVGWRSGFLGAVAHVFLLLALLALLAQALDMLPAAAAAEEAEPLNESPVPAVASTNGAEQATAEVADKDGSAGAD